MSINELSQYGEFALPLEMLYQKSGNCPMNGYLGDEKLELHFDEEGRLEFSTHKEVEDAIVDSLGVVLKDSVLIEQKEKSSSSNFYRLYSWDVSKNQYTYLSFDDSSVLDRYYRVMKRFDANLCDEDISSLFQQMGLSFESITQVLLNQKRNPMDAMFDDETIHTGDSFVM